MMTAPDLKSAMILSGGGAYGAYEVGVMEALFTGQSPATGFTPLDPAIFCGTSVGAFNASALVSQPEVSSAQAVASLKEAWLDVLATNPQRCGNGVYRIRGDPFTFLSAQCLTGHPLAPWLALAADSAFFAQDWFRRGVHFVTSPEDLEQRVLELVDLSSLFSVEPFEHSIKEVISLEGIRRSPKVLKIVATNWNVGIPVIFGNAEMTDPLGYQAILASTALPGIFPPVKINDTFFVDGGVAMNTPLSPAIRAGADILHVVLLDPPTSRIPLDRVPNSLDTFYRTQVIEWAVKVREDLATILWINRGLALLERAEAGEALPETDSQDLLRVTAPIQERLKEGRPFRKLTIHLYQPQFEPEGPLGMLDLNPERIRARIAQGFNDAVRHDCEANHCILPPRPISSV